MSTTKNYKEYYKPKDNSDTGINACIMKVYSKRTMSILKRIDWDYRRWIKKGHYL